MQVRGLRVVVTTLFLALPTALWAQTPGSNTDGIALPVSSTAEPDGVLSLLHNSAGLSVLPAWEFRAYNTQFADGPGEGTALMFGMPVFAGLSMGTAIEFLRPADARPNQRLSLGAAYRFSSAFRMGFVYRHWFSDGNESLDGTNSVDVGLLMRPFGWMSLGLNVRDLNSPRIGGVTHPRIYDVAFGFQPGTDRLTIEIGADLAEDGSEIGINSRLRFTAIRGWEIVGTTRLVTDDAGSPLQVEVGAGMAFHFGKAGIDGGAFFSGEDLSDIGFTVGARLSGSTYGPLWRRTGKTLLLELGRVGEEPRPSLSGGGGTFTHLVAYLDRVRRDDTISGLLIRDKGAGYGWAQAEELRAIFKQFIDDGKKVIVYMDQGGLSQLFMYSVADKIILNPAGGLRITGLRSTITYYREVLDRLQVSIQWVRFGKYKSYPESFERKGPSDAALEVKNSILDTMYGHLVDGVAAGRGKSAEVIRKTIDEGPFIAEEALAAGLVDKLAFWDEVTEYLKTIPDEVGPIRVTKSAWPGRTAPQAWGSRPAIAIVPVEGSIVDGGSSRMPLLGTKNVGDTTIIKAVQAAAGNRNVKAIVLRINTPGGSSVASDHMHRAIFKAAKGKPIIASMGNVAASGGYYIAMGAREVMASDTTVTGSIGIFTGKPAFGRLFRLLGLGRTTLKRGKNADLMALDEPWTPEQLALMEQKVEHFYELFLKRVAEGRKITRDEAHAVAQGRVWMGSQALANKLTDSRGGVLDAIRRGKVLAGLNADAEVSLVFYPQATLAEKVRNTLGIEMLIAKFGHLKDALAIAYPFLNDYKPGEPLALMPYHLEFK